MTTTAKKEILARIRNAQQLSGTPQRYEAQRTYVRSTDMGRDELRELLIDRLIDYKAEVVTATGDSLADVLATTLHDKSCKQVRYAEGLDPALFAGFDGQASADDRTVDPRTLNDVDAVITDSHVSCAQTGTICLMSNPVCGRRALTLVPDRHVCIVRMDTVVYGVPEMIGRLDASAPVTMISGPSATSDIELARVEGVHGPRDLIVIVVD